MNHCINGSGNGLKSPRLEAITRTDPNMLPTGLSVAWFSKNEMNVYMYKNYSKEII